MLLHASCVSINHHGVLLCGPSGYGKSDLALRLIGTGAQLVADDQTELRVENGALMATAPPSISGLIEVRHVGLLRMPHVQRTSVSLYVELTGMDKELERLPAATFKKLLDCPIRLLRLPAFTASTPAKIRAALQYPDAS